MQGRNLIHTPPCRRAGAALMLAAVAGAGTSLLGLSRAAANDITWANTNPTFSAGSAWIGGSAPVNSTSADVGIFQGVPIAQPLLTGTTRAIGALDLQSGGWIFTPSIPGNRLSFGTGVALPSGGSFSGINSTTNPTGTAQFDIGVNISNTPVQFNYSLDVTYNGLFESDGAGTTRSLTFAGSGNSVMNGPLNLSSGSTTIARTFTFNMNGAGSLLVNGPIITSSGSTGTFAIDGTGLIELTNTANSQFQTRLAGGTLRIHADSNLGAIPASFTENNINVTGSSTLQLAAGAGSVAINANRGIAITGTTTRTMSVDVMDAADTLVFNTPIVEVGGGSGNFTKHGGGTLILNAANSLNGTLNFAAGTLVVGNSAALGAGTLRFGGGTITSTAPLTINNTVSMTNLSTVAGSQTITFAGPMLYSGTTERTERFSQEPGIVTQITGGMLISTDAPRQFTFTGTGDVNVSSVIADTPDQPGTLRFIGSGNVTLGAANTYSGENILDDADVRLHLGNNQALSQGLIFWNAGAIFSTEPTRTIANPITMGAGTVTGTRTIGGPTNWTFTGPIFLLGGGEQAISIDAVTSATFAGTVTDAGNGTGLVKDGVGVLTLAGNNVYAGGTSINGGRLRISSNANLGAAAGAIRIENSAVLETTAGITSARNLLVGAGGGNIDTGAFDSTFTGTVTGEGTLGKHGSGVLTVNNIRVGTLSVVSGTLLVATNGTNTGLSILRAAQMTGTPPGGGDGFGAVDGHFDLTDNDLILTAESRAKAQSDIAFARNGGAWDQEGITSSAAASQVNHATMLGVLSGAEYHGVAGATATFDSVPVNDTDVLVKYTWYGDTDFNGIVNFDDYVRADNGFNNQLSGWLNGDFDLNDVVNFDDYVLIDLAFNCQSGTLRRALDFLDGSDRSLAGMTDPALEKVAEHFADFGPDYAAHFLSAVPEPASVFVLGTASSAIAIRRRRRQH